jgi:hypothetical protein
LVYQGRTKEGGKRVAIKKLDLSKQTDIPALENEISMISMSKTDTIVEYLGSYMWQNQVRQRLPPRGTQYLYQICARARARACAFIAASRSCARA